MKRGGGGGGGAGSASRPLFQRVIADSHLPWYDLRIGRKITEKLSVVGAPLCSVATLYLSPAKKKGGGGGGGGGGNQCSHYTIFIY